jgi:hypothetical protein
MTTTPSPEADAAVEALAKALRTVLHRTYVVNIADMGSYKAQSIDALDILRREGFTIMPLDPEQAMRLKYPLYTVSSETMTDAELEREADSIAENSRAADIDGFDWSEERIADAIIELAKKYRG